MFLQFYFQQLRINEEKHWADSKCKTLTFSNRSAKLICISLIARGTDAVCAVVSYFTDSIYSTLVVVDTWIFTLLVNTC